MSINAISLRPAFKGEEAEAAKRPSRHKSPNPLPNTEEVTDTTSKAPTTDKILSAGIAGATALTTGKAIGKKAAEFAEKTVKEVATDFTKKAEEVKAQAKTKAGKFIQNFRTNTLPKIAQSGFSKTLKNGIKWVAGIFAAIGAAVAVLRDKDKDGTSDLVEAVKSFINVIKHPETVGNEKVAAAEAAEE